MTNKWKTVTGQRSSTGIRLTGITCLLFLIFSFQPAKAQNPITFRDERIENHFPDKLVFHITAGSSEGEITAAKLYYKFRNDLSETQVIVDLTPAGEVGLTYTWETGDITMPPSTPVFYHWEVTDSAGNRVSSQEELFYYDDIRYDWQVLENDNMAVWWHDRPETFGEKVYDIANQAFEGQRTQYGAGLTYPIRIIIYNNDEEFAGWHSYVSEFIGGQAFPPLGITTQIVPESEYLNHWLNDVIPHEISHLYFYQATYHPLVIAPAWLNEGLAQYNEFNDNSFAIELAEKEIRAGKLIPLTALTGSFGYNEDKVRLAYAESFSAVAYLVETYGEDGLAALLAAYRDGLPDQAAFERTFDNNLSDFETDWLTWMGAPEGMYGTATPTVTLSIPPTPTMAGIESYQASETPEPAIIPSDTPVETSTPQPVTKKETQEPTIAQADLPDQGSPEARSDPVNQSNPLVCLAGLLPGLLLWVGVRDHLKEISLEVKFPKASASGNRLTHFLSKGDTMTEEQISKREILEAIRVERKSLEATINQLTKAQITQPGVENDWSVKDILAHITDWELRMVTWIEESLLGEVPQRPAPGMTWDDLDLLNQQTYLANKDRPLADMLTDFHSSYQEAFKTVQALSEDDVVDPQRFAWRDGDPMWHMVAANTWWHYKEHRQTIVAWLKDG